MAGARLAVLCFLSILSCTNPLGCVSSFELDTEQVNLSCQFCDLALTPSRASYLSAARSDESNGGLLAASVQETKTSDVASLKTVSSASTSYFPNRVFAKELNPLFSSCAGASCHRRDTRHSIKSKSTRQKGKSQLPQAGGTVPLLSVKEEKREVPPPFQWLLPPYPTSSYTNSSSASVQPSHSRLSSDYISVSSIGSSPLLPSGVASFSSAAPGHAPSSHHPQLGAPSMILPSSWKLPNPVSSQPSEQISDTSYAAESNATERPLVDYLHLGDLKNGFKTQPSETMSMLLQAEGGQRAFASVSPSLRHAHSTKPVAIISSSGVPFHSGAGSVAARAVLNQERGTFHKNRKEYPVYYTKQSLSGRRYASKLLPYTQRTNTGKERNRRQVTHSDPAHTAEATPVDSASIESASSRLSFSSALCFDCKQERHVLAADTAAGLPPRNRSAENSDDASAFPLLFSWNGRSSSSKNTASPQLSATSNASQHLNTELADQLQRWIAKAQSGSAVFHQLAGPPEWRKTGMGVEKKQQIEKPLRADIFSTLISQEDILRATVGVYRTIYLWQLLDRNDRNSTDSTGLPSFHSPCSWQGSRTFPNTVTEARRTSSSRLSSEEKNLGKQFGTTAFYVEPDASETSSVPAAPAFGDAYSQTVSSSPPGSQEFPRLSCDQSGTEHLPVWMATQMHLAHKRGEPLNPQYVQSSPDVWLLPFVFLRWLDMWKRQVTLQEEASRAGMEFSQEEKMLGDDEQRSTSAPVARQTDVQEGHGSDARAPDDKKGMKKRFLRKSSRQG